MSTNTCPELSQPFSPILFAVGLPIALASGPLAVVAHTTGTVFNRFTCAVVLSSLSCSLLVKLAQTDLASLQLPKPKLLYHVAVALGVVVLYDTTKILLT